MNRPFFLSFLLGAAALASLPGCFVVRGTSNVAAATVTGTANVTAAAVTGTGKVLSATIQSGGTVSQQALRQASHLTRAGAVVFFDPKTGAIFQTPWRQGLSLAAAAQAAKVRTGFAAARLVRSQQIVPVRPGMDVQGGDVVQLGSSVMGRPTVLR